MGFNWGKAGTGTLLGGSGFGIANGFGVFDPNKSTVNQVPLLTPGQSYAQNYLMDFIKNGNLPNGYTPGAAYKGSLGDFNMTPVESAATGKLGSFVNSGTPSIYSAGETGLASLINGDMFNPLAAGSGYDAFKTEANRNADIASANLKNKAAFAGNLFSTDTVKNLGDIQAQTTNSINSKLGDLYQNYMNQRVGGIMAAPGFAQTGQALQQAPITAGFNYGGLQRDLNTGSASANLTEWLRQRQDQLLPLNTANSLGGMNAQFGVPSITTQTPSTGMQLLQAALQAGGMYLGAKG